MVVVVVEPGESSTAKSSTKDDFCQRQVVAVVVDDDDSRRRLSSSSSSSLLVQPPHNSTTRFPRQPMHRRRRRRRPPSRRSRRLVGYYQCTVTSSVAVYWLFVSLIPIYNKFFFQKSLFPYPIATAGIQLLAVSTILGTVNIVQHYYEHYYDEYVYNKNNNNNNNNSQSMFIRRFVATGENKNKNKNNNGVETAPLRTTTNQQTQVKQQQQQQQRQQVQKSWIFGPYLLWKLRWCFPIGILFGLKYGVTNLGLHLVPAPIHLLLQATDLVWTVLGAWLINGEKVTWIESLCLMGCVGGSVCLGWQIMVSDHHNQESTSLGGEEQNTSTPLFAICVNLTSPMLLGLCISTLRLACTELMRPNNRVGGTVSAVELTAIKLCISSAVALVLALFMERGGGTSGSGSGNGGNIELPWWIAFLKLPVSTKIGVLGGSILIAVFQANCTFLTYLTSAVTVGLVGQVKIIPQWIMATLFSVITTTTTSCGSSTTGLSSSSSSSLPSKLLVLHPTALFGALLICGSAAVFAYVNASEVINIAHPIVTGQKNNQIVTGDEENENGCTDVDDDSYDDNENDDVDGGSSAFVALTNTLSRRRSSVLSTRSGDGSDAGAIMLSSHSLRISLNNNVTTSENTKRIKPLLLVSDADFWGENLMRFDEFDSTTDEGEDGRPNQLGQQNTAATNRGTTGYSGVSPPSTEKSLLVLSSNHDGYATPSAMKTMVKIDPPNYNSVT